jgi:hypothetical protein
MSAGKGGIDMEIGGLTVGGRVAEAFDLAATLHVRHLARGTSLTLKSLLAALDQNGPERFSTLATVTMVTQPVVSNWWDAWNARGWLYGGSTRRMRAPCWSKSLMPGGSYVGNSASPSMNGWPKCSTRSHPRTS